VTLEFLRSQLSEARKAGDLCEAGRRARAISSLVTACDGDLTAPVDAEIVRLEKEHAEQRAAKERELASWEERVRRG
jgi:hypothetical protein